MDPGAHRLELDETGSTSLVKAIGNDDREGLDLNLDDFTQVQSDGTTACGCWIYSGVFPSPEENRAHKRQPEGRYGRGWGYAWPHDRRILYNRASCDRIGKPYPGSKRIVWWDEQAKRWTGHDVPDVPVATDGPDSSVSAMPTLIANVVAIADVPVDELVARVSRDLGEVVDQELRSRHASPTRTRPSSRTSASSASAPPSCSTGTRTACTSTPSSAAATPRTCWTSWATAPAGRSGRFR